VLFRSAPAARIVQGFVHRDTFRNVPQRFDTWAGYLTLRIVARPCVPFPRARLRIPLGTQSPAQRCSVIETSPASPGGRGGKGLPRSALALGRFDQHEARWTDWMLDRMKAVATPRALCPCPTYSWASARPTASRTKLRNRRVRRHIGRRHCELIRPNAPSKDEGDRSGHAWLGDERD